MKRENAINYLQRKKKIRQPCKTTEEKYVTVRKKPKVKKVKIATYEDPKFNKKEEKEIKKVMKKGKIYGDPLVVMNG